MSRLLHNDTVVIVGGGSIGLSTAYNLAKSSFSSLPKIRIIVIDAFDQPFLASSSTCTGCFHYAFPEQNTQPLLPLGKYSFDLWEAEAENEAFNKVLQPLVGGLPAGDLGIHRSIEAREQKRGYPRDLTGLIPAELGPPYSHETSPYKDMKYQDVTERAQSSFEIESGSGQSLDRLPDWVQKRPVWDVNDHVLGTYTATVNPCGLGKWLTEQCLELGVEIKTSLKIVNVSLSSRHKVQAVTCLRDDQTQHASTADNCSLLVDLGLRVYAGDWVMFKNPCPTTDSSVAFVSFASLLGEKFEFAGRDDGTIWACGRRNLTAVLPSPGHFDEPDESLIEDLSRRARKWLNWGCTCTDKHHGDFQIVSKGRAFRPTTKSGLPVISEAASSDLTTLAVDEDDQVSKCSTGVFVCWGHGSYGLTLGMGSGRLMGQLMRGEKPDIDLSLFALN